MFHKCNKIFLMLGVILFSLVFVGCEESGHTHTFKWESDSVNHYYKCTCGEIEDNSFHVFEWVIDSNPTEEITGMKHEECIDCGYKQKQGTIINVLKNEDKIDNKKFYDIHRFFSDDIKLIEDSVLSLKTGERLDKFFFDYEELNSFFAKYIEKDITNYFSENIFENNIILLFIRCEPAIYDDIQYYDFSIQGLQLKISETVLSDIYDDALCLLYDFIIIPKNDDILNYNFGLEYMWLINSDFK